MTIDDKVLDAIRAGVHQNRLICSRTGINFRKVDPALQRLRRAGKIELRRPEGWFAREATEHAQQFAAARDAVIEAEDLWSRVDGAETPEAAFAHIEAALLAERSRATRSALDGLARWARDPGWCLCSEGIAVGHHRKAVCVAAEIERRAREARARGRKR